ncbi:MAG: lipoyl(octanoyl) transferase LipB [Planctomycetota bacterium]|nr:lipoyl(octanoyl) transferase LipB [Planctomycetota bacterium]
MSDRSPALHVEHLGRLAYAPAYEAQRERLERVLAAREAADAPLAGFILTVEHDPVVTISRRPGARDHLLASPDLLARHGVSIEETDRGGDITYHGPGQLVVYPVLDLTLLNLGLHNYMRLLETSVIDTCAAFGVATAQDPGATGVWTLRDGAPHAKIAAMGVRVRRWISMHGLALNVRTNLDHFALIVPCGLAGRPVTTLHRELGERCPPDDAVRDVLVENLRTRVRDAFARAHEARQAAADASIDLGPERPA